VGKRTCGGRRALSPCIHVGSNDAAFRWQLQPGRIVWGSFQETAPRKTAENTVTFDGSQPPWWQWKFGGRNNTTIFDNIDISDLPTLICWCSSRLWCCRFSMSNVYIGRTLALSNHYTCEYRIIIAGKLGCVFSAVCDCFHSFIFLFVNQISPEMLNGFAPNSQGRRVSSLAQTSLNVNVKGQGDRSPGYKMRCAFPSPPAVTEWSCLLQHRVTRHCQGGGLCAVYVW